MIHKKSHMACPLLMLSAAIMFSLMSILVKLMPHGYTVWHLGFIRCFGGMLVLLIFFGRKKNLYNGHNIALLILRGCSGAIGFFSGYGSAHPSHLNRHCSVLRISCICRLVRLYDL